MRGFYGMMSDIRNGYSISEKQFNDLKREFDISQIPVEEIETNSGKRFRLTLPRPTMP